MSTVLGDDLSKQDLWTFIKSTKATQLASLKLLQQFVLSLNKQELRHLIEFYLKSKLADYKSFNSDGLTLKQTAAKLLDCTTQNQNEAPSSIDIDNVILNKLNQSYGNKYNKKIFKKIQQNKNTTILSIHPQVLAYSFQFLSFKELCKTQTVCVYFSYLNKQYPGLTHYYIKLDSSFFSKAMKYRISLNNLSMFKHIVIKVAYSNKNLWNKEAERRTNLFQHILKVIIKQSKSNLDILTIDTKCMSISNAAIRYLPYFNVLLFIMDQFSPLPISRLIWKSDIFKPSEQKSILNILQDIVSKMQTSFPKLKHFIIGRFFFPGFWHDHTASIDIPNRCTALNQFVTGAGINWNQLESLHLDGTWNLFEAKTDLIKLISVNMTNLKKLSVISYVTTASDIQIENIQQHTGLKELSVRITKSGRFSDDQQFENTSQRILSCLFSVFIGINKFKYDFEWAFLKIEWKILFDLLIRKKRMYSDSLLPLESVQFKVENYLILKQVLKEMTELRYIGLKHFGIEWVFGRMRNNINVMDRVINHLIPFLKIYDDKHSKLSSLNISFSNYVTHETSYFESILNLLAKIPPSVISMKLKLPRHHVGNASIKEIGSTKLVKKLCQMLLEKKSKLEMLSFDGLKLSTYPKKYLMFFFGFNNKLFMHSDKYSLKFC